MAKDLVKPLLIVAPQWADRLEITEYAVNMTTRCVTLRRQASRDDGQGGRIRMSFPPLVLDAERAGACLAVATRQIVRRALEAAKTEAAVSEKVLALVDANPTVAAKVYYEATRDGLDETF